MAIVPTNDPGASDPYDMCCHRWQAPLMLPNGHEGWATQTCSLKKHHQGKHRSLSGVITTYSNADAKEESDGPSTADNRAWPRAGT